MGTKVKGLLKGLRYISQIFDEPKKEADFQIGMPTDVKHVAHIGWDNNGPAVDSPSWMKGFESTEGGHQSVEDSAKQSFHTASNSFGESSVTDSPPKKEKSRSGSTNSLKKEKSRSSSPQKEKSRSSRRRHSKGSSGSLKLNQDENVATDSPARGDLPDIPKKTRRKKPKDSSTSRSSKHRSLVSASDPQSSLKSRSAKENQSSQAAS